VSIIEKAVAKLGEWNSAPVHAATVQVHEGVAIAESPAELREMPSSGEAAFVEKTRSVDATEKTLRYEEIDLSRLKDAGMVTPDGTRSQIFEEFRLIKRPLLKNALGQGPAPVRRGN